MTVEDSDEVAPARSVENDRPRHGVSDTSDTESLNAEKSMRTSQHFGARLKPFWLKAQGQDLFW